MHEIAIAEALFEQVRTLAPPGTKVCSVSVEVGGLEHLDAQVLSAAWQSITTDGELAEALLDVQGIPVRVRCRSCNSESQPEDLAILTCAACGAVRPEVIAGSGIVLRSLEVQEES